LLLLLQGEAMGGRKGGVEGGVSPLNEDLWLLVGLKRGLSGLLNY